MIKNWYVIQLLPTDFKANTNRIGRKIFKRPVHLTRFLQIETKIFPLVKHSFKATCNFVCQYSYGRQDFRVRSSITKHTLYSWDMWIDLLSFTLNFNISDHSVEHHGRQYCLKYSAAEKAMWELLFKIKNPIFISDQEVIMHCYFAVHHNSGEEWMTPPWKHVQLGF